VQNVSKKLAKSGALGGRRGTKDDYRLNKECFDLVTEGSYWTRIANVKRERILNSRAASEKLLEPKPKPVRTRGTVSDECNVQAGEFKNRVQIGRLSANGLVGNAGNLKFYTLVNGKPVVMLERNRW